MLRRGGLCAHNAHIAPHGIGYIAAHIIYIRRKLWLLGYHRGIHGAYLIARIVHRLPCPFEQYKRVHILIFRGGVREHPAYIPHGSSAQQRVY